MKWPSAVFKSLLVVIDVIIFFARTTSSMTVNYVKPSKLESTTPSPCSDVQRPCLTLSEYTSDRDVYFINNTIFYFYPGMHTLRDSLVLEDLHNLSFHGWPRGDSEDLVKIVPAIGPSAGISLTRSYDIKISSISFVLYDNFTFIMRFEHSHSVQLSNISIYGNGYSGCSSIISQGSELDINNASFFGIKGILGAALMSMASNITFRGSNVFVGNTAASGGSIYLSESNLVLSGVSLFQNNTSLMYSEEAVNKTELLCNYRMEREVITIGSGGAILCFNSCLKVHGQSNFTANVANSHGGALSVANSELFIQGLPFFSWNIANVTGGALTLYNTISNINGSLSLKKNEAKLGGGMEVRIGNLSIQGCALFDGNTAKYDGGALHLIDSHFEYCGSTSFGNNMASYYQGVGANTSNVVTVSSLSFVRNVGYGSSIQGQYGCSLKLIGTVHFNESVQSAIVLFTSNITFIGTIHFYSNRGDGGAAVRSSNSNIVFSGTVHFERNQAIVGGAMLLIGASKLILKPKLSVSFISNHAEESGGALYFSDSQCSLGSTVPIECFIIIDGPLASISNISLHFENNSAGSTGNILYGGQFDKCRFFFRNGTEQSNLCDCNTHDHSEDALEILTNISDSTQVEHDHDSLASSISSPAKEIRFCNGVERSMWLSDEYHSISVHPGGKFSVRLIALGQTNYSVSATIFWERHDDNDYYRSREYRLSPPSQTIAALCTQISFQLHSGVSGYFYPDFKLYPQNLCQNLIEGLILNIEVLPCPLGFALSNKDLTCDCDKKLQNFARSCNIDTSSIERMKNNFWIFKLSNEMLLLFEYRCPLDYCTNALVNVTLDDPSVQCDFNRTGTLCGKCQEGFSLAFGSLHCIHCDNNHTTLVILFAVAGIVLIAFIFLARLTVSVGTLGGLLFYANIIQANQQAYFPRDTINFFTTFISWLNLDLGIETCFYDGMDTYAYSWFQFLFPFYLWLLVGCIILASRYSQSIAKKLGQNPVAVLATVLLMSYSKILSAVIVPLTLSYLTYYTASNETQSVVWLYDASVQFFREPKHIALGLFATLCLAILVAPYIFVLFFGHWLQGCSNWRIISWMNKIKPFMDAYHAPYRKYTRYWTGLLLLSRLALFLTFAVNARGSEGINLLAVSSVSIALLALQRRIYEHWLKDLLESSFLLNLGVFSVATFYLKEESKDIKSQLILSSIFVGITFITFLGILLFHIGLVLKSSNTWKVHIMLPFVQESLLLSKILRITPVKDKTTAGNKDATELNALPTSTEIDVDLREPLLEMSESQAAAYK